jgi:phytoene/squalene synthetase
MASRVLPAPIYRRLDAVHDYVQLIHDRAAQASAAGIEGLTHLETQLRDLYAGQEAEEPVLRRLGAAVAACQLPMEPLLRLIEAARADQVVHQYGTFGELLDHYHQCADPIGQLTLHIFGQATPQRVALSDRMCSALQLIQHLRDLPADTQRGYYYLPKEDMDRFGVPPSDLRLAYATWPLRNLISFQAERARVLLEFGAPLAATLHGWARLSTRARLAHGRATLLSLRRTGCDPLATPTSAGPAAVLTRWLPATGHGPTTP